MSPLVGRPALEGPHLTGRALLLLTALLLASAPVSQLLAGSSWLLLTLLAAAPVILGGVVLRTVVRHQMLVPLAQAGLLLVLVLVVETALGLLRWQDGPLAVLREQAQIVPAGVTELTSGIPPLALGDHGTVIIVALVGLATLLLDLMFLDLGWHTPAAVLVMSSLLIPSLQQPAGGTWWQVAAPVLAGGMLFATRTVHADPRYLLGDRRPQAGPAAHRGRTLAAVGLCLVLVAAMTPALGTALPRVADARIALDIDALERWQDPDAPALGAVMIDDDVSVRRSLLDQGNAEVLRYSTTAETPSYLRLRTLNDFDGEAFRSDPAPSEIGPLPASFSDARDDRAAVSGGTEDFERTDYQIVSLGGDRLPVPENVRSVQGADRSLNRAMRVQPETGEVALTQVSTGLLGQRYTVETEPRTSTAEQLRAVDPGMFEQPFETGYISRDQVPLPASSLAEQIVRSSGAETGYDTAIAFQEHFRSTFAYSLTVSSPPGQDPLESFLEDRIGYCEQFAAAFALMMTSQGYPTRVVIGFTPGEQDGEEWTVRSSNAHAWPEVWFGREHGWVRFEPTPAAAANGVRPPETDEQGGQAEEPTTTPEAPAEDAPTTEAPSEQTSSAEEQSAAAETAQAADGGLDAPSETTVRRLGGGAVTLMALGGLLAAAAAATVLGIRRRRLRARDERWEALREPADGGAEGTADGAGSATAGAALAAERRDRRAGELAWGEIARELSVRATAIRWLRITGAWGRTPTRLALDPALPPHRALEDLLAQAEAAELEVTAEHRAAARRIADAHVTALYAAPLPEEDPTPSLTPATPSIVPAGQTGANEGRNPPPLPHSREKEEPDERERPQHPLRRDVDLLIALLRAVR